ncbi:MAG: helix-turn-helix domain-containing protein, partial [Nitrososphaerales archaeon]
SPTPSPSSNGKMSRRGKKLSAEGGSNHGTKRNHIEAGRGIERRLWAPGQGCRLVACVDVRPSRAEGDTLIEADAFWEVAVRRIESTIRPDDQICMLGQSRLALCMGDGAYRVEPAALAIRIAHAMGDHLSVGTTELTLEVSVGIGTAQSDMELSELSSAALASLRTVRRPGATQRSGGRRYIAVTHTPGRPAKRSVQLCRRVLLSLSGDHDGRRELRDQQSEWLPVPEQDKSEADRQPDIDGFRVLLVDPGSRPEEIARPALEVVATAARRRGARPVMSTAGDLPSVVKDINTIDPAAVVVVLQMDQSRRSEISGDRSGVHRSWERAAQLVKAVRDEHLPVIALSMGTSAAALAACVEQGALGLFDLDLLGYELSRISNGESGTNGHDEPKASGHLPAPFDALVHLTPSERRVLFQMMEGRSAADIAACLVVSVTTVRSHIRSVLRKLNVNSQLAAVALAFGTVLDQASSG